MGVVGGMDAYCVSMSNAEGLAMKAVREKMLATNWAQEWENKRTMFSYGEEMSTDPLEAMMLKQFVHMQQPKRILEVGMFVGFGATAMMEGSPTAHVVSLEIDPYLKKWLSDCLEKFPDIRKRHEVMLGPALESLPKITGQFDMVFVDANKSEYKRYVELMLERDLIAPGGTIFCDNVLYNGYPYLPSHFDSQPARRGFGNDIKEFNSWVCQHPELEQVVLPIRDGVSILRKKPALSFSPEPRTTSDSIDELDADTLRKLYLEEKKKNEAQAAELAKLQELNRKLQAQDAPKVAKGPKTVLLATEKPFAAEAVAEIDSTLKEAGYTLKKLEKYTKEQQLLDALSDADAVIIRSDIASAKVMDAGKNLKLIVRAGAGYDNIDLPAAAERNIITMNTPGANANAVAELAFGMMIENARNHWDGSSGYELMGKSLAVYGFGAVARNLHRIAKAFNMKFSAYDPYLTKEQIEGAGATYCAKVEELFDSQFVSLHCPATAETKNSINYALLSKMPKNAVLVNTARPEVVHEEDLKKMLQERTDFAYVADVPPKNLADLHANPDMAKRVFVTKKKMGAQTSDANSNAGTQAAMQIVGFFERGEKRGQVKP